MCGIVGAVARDNVVPTLIEGIRRLEYRGYDSSGLAVINGGLHRLVSTARVADLAAQASATRHHRHDGHLAHALGDAWRADAHQRASACQPRRDRGGAQRHHRELRALARAAAAAGLSLRHPDRYRGDRSSHPSALSRRPAARGAQGGGRVSRRVCDRGDQHARARPHRRRARGQPAARRHLESTITSSRRTRARLRR